MVAASPDSDETLPESSTHSQYSGGKKGPTRPQQNTRKPGGKGGSGGRRGGGGGSGGHRQGGPANRPQQQGTWPQQWGSAGAPWPWQWPWTFPPCPYPSNNWTRPNIMGRPPAMHSGPGVLGTRPQAYQAAVSGQPTPTDIEAAMYTLGLNVPDANWYMDTGATSHMTSGQGNLSSYVNLSTKRGILVGNGHSIPIQGYGHTTLPSPHPPLQLKNVLHAPKLIKNLVSVRKFTCDNSVSVEFDPFGFSVKDYQTGTPLMRSNSRGELYPLTTTNNASPSTFAALAPTLWHERLGHPGASILSSLSQNNFIQCTSSSSSPLCNSCPLGKHIKLPFVPSHSSTLLPFDIIHSDLWTSPILSSSGHRYYIVLLDDFSNYLWTFPISKKSDVFSIFTTFQAFIQTQFERPVKNIQCDNGKEFDNGPFRDYCAKNGMSFRFSCPYTSSQNGKAERKIRTINNMIRTLMTHASIPPSFWHHALAMATYLLNILPSKVLASQSPLQILYHRDPLYSHLRVFGCLCYPLFPSTTIHKLQPRSTPCVFLGYPSNHREYKCYDISSRKIIISRHVIFDETQFPFSKLHTPHKSTYDFLDDGLSPYVVHHLVSHNSPLPTSGPQLLEMPDQPTHNEPAQPAHPNPPSPTGPRVPAQPNPHNSISVPAGPLPPPTDLAPSLTQPAPQIS